VTVTLEKNSYKNYEVAGLLFLQNIQDKRWTRPLPIGPIMEFVGGDKAIRKLIFVTTHWDQIELNLGIARERQFCLPWEPLLRAGACMDHFDKKTETAWRILDRLLYY